VTEVISFVTETGEVSVTLEDGENEEVDDAKLELVGPQSQKAAVWYGDVADATLELVGPQSQNSAAVAVSPPGRVKVE
jgi:hypothetical protein